LWRYLDHSANVKRTASVDRCPDAAITSQDHPGRPKRPDSVLALGNSEMVEHAKRLILILRNNRDWTSQQNEDNAQSHKRARFHGHVLPDDFQEQSMRNLRTDE